MGRYCALYFGVSSVTLKRRRRREYQLPVGENFDHIFNDELDTLVVRVLHNTPKASFNLILGASRARGNRSTVVSPDGDWPEAKVDSPDDTNQWY